jgi:PAS domain S-box-containing protein
MNISSIKIMDSKEGTDALFLFAAEGILVANGESVITRVNPSAEKLFGYEKDELIGQKIEILIPRRLAEKHVHQRTNYNANPQARTMGSGRELFGLKKDGSEFPLEISLSPYSTAGENFVIAFIVDITLRKQAEEKLKNYSAELEKQVRNRTLILEEAVEQLEKTKLELHNSLEKERELNELKTRFVSMASHEFRTPLTTMLTSLSLVTKYGENNDKSSQAKHVGKIKSSIHNLTDILNDFLSVSKLEEGKIENLPEMLNVQTYIAEIISEMEFLAVNNQIIQYNHTGESIGNVDKKLLKNILFNLISNAIKFSPEGGIIDVKSSIEDSKFKISVQDHGIGISKDDQKHLFERFFRGHNATHIQGTGLGLSIIAKYAELMNGTIDFESQENKGTTFTIIIPQ